MTFDFRTGTPADATACAKIIRDWGKETPWMTKLDELTPMAAYWRRVFETEPVWVAEKQSCVVGFCVRTDDNVSALYVARQARNHGVGKRLLDFAKADRDWITVWAYELNVPARRFYRREGLVEISRVTEKYDDGVSLVDVEHRWRRPT